METAIIILGIISLTLLVFSIWLGWLYVGQLKKHASEREELINKGIADRSQIEADFTIERERWLNKILKINGISPIKGDQKPPEPTIHITESVLNRNARLKREQQPASEVTNA